MDMGKEPPDRGEGAPPPQKTASGALSTQSKWGEAYKAGQEEKISFKKYSQQQGNPVKAKVSQQQRSSVNAQSSQQQGISAKTQKGKQQGEASTKAQSSEQQGKRPMKTLNVQQLGPEPAKGQIVSEKEDTISLKPRPSQQQHNTIAASFFQDQHSDAAKNAQESKQGPQPPSDPNLQGQSGDDALNAQLEEQDLLLRNLTLAHTNKGVEKQTPQGGTGSQQPQDQQINQGDQDQTPQGGSGSQQPPNQQNTQPMDVEGGNASSSGSHPSRKDKDSKESGEASSDSSDSTTVEPRPQSFKPSPQLIVYEKQLQESTLTRISRYTVEQIRKRWSKNKPVLAPIELFQVNVGDKDKIVYRLDKAQGNDSKDGTYRYPRVGDPVRRRERFLTEESLTYVKGRIVCLTNLGNRRDQYDESELRAAQSIIKTFIEYDESFKFYLKLEEAQKESYWNKLVFAGLWTNCKPGFLLMIRQILLRKQNLNYGFESDWIEQAYEQAQFYKPDYEEPEQLPQVQEDTHMAEAAKEKVLDYWKTVDVKQRTSTVGNLPPDFMESSKKEGAPLQFDSFNKAGRFTSQIQKLLRVSDVYDYIAGMQQMYEIFSREENPMDIAQTESGEIVIDLVDNDLEVGYPDPQHLVDLKLIEPLAQNKISEVGSRKMGFSLEGYPLITSKRTELQQTGLLRTYVFWTNMMYLRRTTFESPDFGLDTASGKKLIHYANVITDFITATFKKQSLVLQDPSFKPAEQSQQVEEDTSTLYKEIHQKLEDLDYQLDFSDDPPQEDEYLKERAALLAQLDKPQQKGQSSKAPSRQTAALELKDLIQKVNIDPDSVLNLTPNQKIILQEEDHKFCSILLEIINHYQQERKGLAMRLYDDTILKDIEQSQPPKIVSNVMSKVGTYEKTFEGQSWQVAYKNQKKRALLVIFSKLTQFATQQDPDSVVPSIPDLLYVVREIIVAGVRAIDTSRYTPLGSLKSQEGKAVTQKSDSRKYDGIVREPYYDWGQGYQFPPKRIPLIQECSADIVDDREDQDFGAVEDDLNLYPTVDIFTFTNIGKYVAAPASHRGDTVYGYQQKHRYNRKPYTNEVKEMFQKRTSEYLFDTSYPIGEPIFELDNVCPEAYVGISPEPDLKLFHQVPRRERFNLTNNNKSVNDYVKEHKVKHFAIHCKVPYDRNVALKPNFAEGLVHFLMTHDLFGAWNMPNYVEQNIYKNNGTHIRLLTVRDMRTGAYYTLTFVWCPTTEVAQQAIKNLQLHCMKGLLAPWEIEILPLEEGRSPLQFPQTLQQLPPGLYEYLVPFSSPLANTHVHDLIRFRKEPYTYAKSSATAAGFWGVLTKAQMLYGLTLGQILMLPRFLVRFMHCYILECYYFYDYKSGQLQSPWAAPENMRYLSNWIKKIPDERATERTAMGFTRNEMDFIVEFQKISGYTLSGQQMLFEESKLESFSDSQWVRDYLTKNFLTLRAIAVQVFTNNVGIQVLAPVYFFPIPPSVLFIVKRLTDLCGQPQYEQYDGMKQDLTIQNERGTLIFCQFVSMYQLTMKGNLCWIRSDQSYYLGVEKGSHLTKPDEGYTLNEWASLISSEIRRTPPHLEGAVLQTAVHHNFRAPYSDYKTFMQIHVMSYMDLFYGMLYKTISKTLTESVRHYHYLMYIVPDHYKGTKRQDRDDQDPDQQGGSKKPRSDQSGSKSKQTQKGPASSQKFKKGSVSFQNTQKGQTSPKARKRNKAKRPIASSKAPELGLAPK